MNNDIKPTNEDALFKQVEADFTALLSEQNLTLNSALLSNSGDTFTGNPIQSKEKAEGK